MFRRFLLGDLPDQDAERLEEECFLSDERFSERLAAEDDLIEAFLDGRLAPHDRERFETRFMSTERGRRKIALANILRGQPKQKTFWAVGVATAAAIAVIIIGAFVRQISFDHNRVVALERERSALQGRVTSLTAEVQQLQARSVSRPESDREKVFSIVLRGVERGSAVTTIVLPDDAVAAELWLLLPRDSSSAYSATLQTVDGRALWRSDALTSRPLDGRKAVLVRVPGPVLRPDTFVISVSASSEPVEDYSFTVRRP